MTITTFLHKIKLATYISTKHNARPRNTGPQRHNFDVECNSVQRDEFKLKRGHKTHAHHRTPAMPQNCQPTKSYPTGRFNSPRALNFSSSKANSPFRWVPVTLALMGWHSSPCTTPRLRGYLPLTPRCTASSGWRRFELLWCCDWSRTR